MDTVFDTYHGFGYYYSNRRGTFEIALPKLSPPDYYIYEFVNISTVNHNAIIVNLRRQNDNGDELFVRDFNYEGVFIDLQNITTYVDNSGNRASDINWNNPILVFTYHDRQTTAYASNNERVYNELRTTPIFPLSAPARSGFGVLKRI